MEQDANGSTDAQDEGYDLDEIEARVLAVMVEKAFVTPDNYPMSINAITTGCNQLTGRDPVMKLSDAAVQDAVDTLVERRLVSRRDSASARVPKFEHLVRLRHSLPPAEQAVLAMLMLRGPQTVGELRSRCERMHRFQDVSEVEAVLEHLADKYPPMVRTLPLAPGTKEVRHMHLMSGDDFANQAAEGITAQSAPRGSRVAELEEEVRRLRQQVDWLTGEFETFRKQFE
ncbi:MAG: YceH family protein [Rhodocyclaceae bacterium]|nr:YceH family protein [Rhodocyclaceae bacterium]